MPVFAAPPVVTAVDDRWARNVWLAGAELLGVVYALTDWEAPANS